MTDDQLNGLIAQLRTHSIGRREFIVRAIALGMSGSAATALATHTVVSAQSDELPLQAAETAVATEPERRTEVPRDEMPERVTETPVRTEPEERTEDPRDETPERVAETPVSTEPDEPPDEPRDEVQERGEEISIAYLVDEDASLRAMQAIENSESASMIYEELKIRGLTPQPERAQLFRASGAGSEESGSLVIMPFVTRELTMEAGLSLSEEEFALGVLVHMRDVVFMESFETLSVQDGSLNIERFDVDQLMDAGSAAIARDLEPVKFETPLLEITPRQTHMIATTTFEALLVDEASRSVHSPEEIEELRRNVPIVNEIGTLVLMRTAIAACCSTSCFGCTSCSSFTINTIKAN